MSEPIKPGDLVVVLRACCNLHIGKISTVLSISTTRMNASAGLKCPRCGNLNSTNLPVAELDFGKGPGWMLVNGLKRIPPLAELEGEKRDEEITA